MDRREWMKVAGAGLLACAAGPAARAQKGEGSADDAMITIPAGPFVMGTSEEDARKLADAEGFHVSWLSGEFPRRVVDLKAFAIDRYPVTNREFAEFCADKGYPARAHWHGKRPPKALLEHPVVCVNLADAQAYAAWAGKRLPTEAEWEKAARGENGLLYPWGSEFDPQACRWNPDPSTQGPGTAPVTAHPRGASPFGVMDMVGNAAEWCADSPGPASAFIKGGCWWTERPINLRPAARNMSGSANNASDFYGFRCVREVG